MFLNTLCLILGVLYICLGHGQYEWNLFSLLFSKGLVFACREGGPCMCVCVSFCWCGLYNTNLFLKFYTLKTFQASRKVATLVQTSSYNSSPQLRFTHF